MSKITVTVVAEDLNGHSATAIVEQDVRLGQSILEELNVTAAKAASIAGWQFRAGVDKEIKRKYA